MIASGFGDLLSQRLSFDEGEDDENPAFGLVDFVNRADVGMVERSRGARLAFEALESFLAPQKVGGEKLERNGTPEFHVLGLVDDAHAALTELLKDPIVTDRLAYHDYAILPLRKANAEPQVLVTRIGAGLAEHV